MVKASLGINILAVLPLASNATSAVSAAMIAPAIMARTESKYFRIVIFFGAFGFLIFNQVFEGPIPLGFSFYGVGDASRIFRLNAHMRAPFFQIAP